MKPRLPALLLGLFLAALPALAQTAATAPAPTATTLKKSTVTVGSAIIPLAPNTKLEVLGRDGDALIVKFRATKGKVPIADTDFDPATPLPEPAVAAVTGKPAATAAKPAPAAPAKADSPPALNTTGTGPRPATNYGKAVQKAKQATEAHKSTHVDPTKGIMDEDPPKKK